MAPLLVRKLITTSTTLSAVKGCSVKNPQNCRNCIHSIQKDPLNTMQIANASEKPCLESKSHQAKRMQLTCTWLQDGLAQNVACKQTLWQQPSSNLVHVVHDAVGIFLFFATYENCGLVQSWLNQSYGNFHCGKNFLDFTLAYTWKKECLECF